MPYIIDWPRKRAIGLAVAAVGLLMPAGPAMASATASSCGSGGGSSVFSAFGDTSSYLPVPGGSFEASTAKWTLTKEYIVSGNEPWYVGSTKDSHSLSLTSGGQAESPAICVNAARPWWRFFATSHNGSTASTLSVWATWQSGSGTKGTTPVTTLLASNYQTWAPTPQLVLGSALGSGTNVTAHLYFKTTGKWQLDDVYVDPYAK